ncbi:hypothetical protein [Methanomethylovorans sp. PtaU1.Bin093]|jgi:hypothetical protein|uniref:hypothetical protein n=1 Tax=Methanomethylovorans sp. PtaU1.Bin093 TaxID=1811679 RepID=UPI0025E518D5|nr:hypothetical protein [Methanomethylovorans sp. PtaU1.Bin093]
MLVKRILRYRQAGEGHSNRVDAVRSVITGMGGGGLKGNCSFPSFYDIGITVNKA